MLSTQLGRKFQISGQKRYFAKNSKQRANDIQQLFPYRTPKIEMNTKWSHQSMIFNNISQQYLVDWFGNYGSQAIGHNHSGLRNTKFINQIGKLALHNPANSEIITKPVYEFYDKFRSFCMPPHFKHLFFTSGGGVAVDNSIKAACDWKTRKNLQNDDYIEATTMICLNNGFHGRTGYALSMTATKPEQYAYFPLFRWFGIDVQDSNIQLEQFKEYYNNIPYILQREIAGIVLEPVQGEGGDVHISKESWISVREFCDQNDILMIADEVQTGLGTTGKLWGYEHLGATPDIIVFGKKTQVCGMMGSTRMDEVNEHVFIKPGRINSTWNGNAVDMYRSKRILEIMEEENIIENSNVTGKYLFNQLKVLEEHHYIQNVRGKGLMCAFDLIDNCGYNINDVCKEALNNGLLIIGCGTNSIRTRPPLDISTYEIDLGIERLKTTLLNCFMKKIL